MLGLDLKACYKGPCTAEPIIALHFSARNERDESGVEAGSGVSPCLFHRDLQLLIAQGQANRLDISTLLQELMLALLGRSRK